MNDFRQLPVNILVQGRSPEDVDDLLRRFFSSQMPQPWPDWQQQTTGSHLRGDYSSRPKGDSLRQSRLALVASLLFLMSGPIYLSRLFSDYPPNLPDFQKGALEATFHRTGDNPPSRKSTPVKKTAASVGRRAAPEDNH